MTILICYDGSPDAEAAIQTASALFPGGQAVILTVWEAFADVVARSSYAGIASPLDFEEIEREALAGARERVQQGCTSAQAAGLNAQPSVVQQQLTMWGTILDEAAALDAAVIVLGSRGLTGLKSLLLGSVSHGVLQHADRPVIVVPGPQVAIKRSRRWHEHADDPGQLHPQTPPGGSADRMRVQPSAGSS